MILIKMPLEALHWHVYVKIQNFEILLNVIKAQLNVRQHR